MIYCLLVVFGFGQLATAQASFPITKIELFPGDQQFLFSAATKSKTPDDLLSLTAIWYPDWYFVVISSTENFDHLGLRDFTFRDARVSNHAAHSTQQGLGSDLDYMVLGLFSPPFGERDFALNHRPVIVLREKTSREIILTNILRALSWRANGSKIFADESFLEHTEPGSPARGVGELKLEGARLAQSVRDAGEPYDIAFYLRQHLDEFRLSKIVVDHLINETSTWKIERGLKSAFKILEHWRPRKFESAALFEAERELFRQVLDISERLVQVREIAANECGKVLQFEAAKKGL